MRISDWSSDVCSSDRDTTSRILDPNLIGSSSEKACAGFCAGFVSFNIAARIMAMMRLDPRTTAGAAVLFSRSRMAMDLASAAVRDGIKAELAIATAIAESLPPAKSEEHTSGPQA